jgi:hypothetical protein
MVPLCLLVRFAAGLIPSDLKTNTPADPGSKPDELSFLLDQLDYISNYTGYTGEAS